MTPRPPNSTLFPYTTLFRSEYNAHPKGLKTTDCVVRAIATATNSEYMEIRRDFNRRKRELGYTSYKDTKYLYDYFKERSEEHTSELQSRPHLVCRLLLEKKK